MPNPYGKLVGFKASAFDELLRYRYEGNRGLEVKFMVALAYGAYVGYFMCRDAQLFDTWLFPLALCIGAFVSATRTHLPA